MQKESNNMKLQKINGIWMLNYSEEYKATKRDKVLFIVLIVVLILSCIN